MANPLTSQGTLNRVRGSVRVINNPGLNVTASYLGKAGISIQLNGNTATMLPTLTGQAQSGEPYVPLVLTIHLLKTQGLSGSYKTQIEDSTNIGDIVVKLDSSVHPDYQITNCAIEGVDGLDAAGTNPEFIVRIAGTWIVNNSLWA